MSFWWDNVCVKRGERIDGAKRGTGGGRQYVIPFFLSSPLLSLFAKYVLGLQKFGEIVVNFAFLFEIGHDFFVETSVIVTEIW